jgi:hypothetical protein
MMSPGTELFKENCILWCWMETEVPQSELPSTNGVMAFICPPRDRNPKKPGSSKQSNNIMLPDP